MTFPYGAAFAAFLAASGGPVAPQQAPAAQQVSVQLIEPAALKAMMQSGAKFVLVDVRNPDEFAAGHIEGAKLMPLPNLEATYSELPKDVKLVVYCRSGKRSAQAVTILKSHGYHRAVSLNGGFIAWTAQVK